MEKAMIGITKRYKKKKKDQDERAFMVRDIKENYYTTKMQVNNLWQKLQNQHTKRFGSVL